ncbi:MAG: ABC transporter ATP-binding protein [Gracilimonas sp.]|nr:ABC transporter ATP-binding protein [Gracilimonas sp.]
MSNSSIFSLTNIDFSYPSENIFEDFNLTIQPGEKIVIKGESGSGKTTLFRLLLGFETPDNGTISFKGSDYSMKITHRLRKEVTWLPQDLNLGSGKTSDLIDFIFEFQANKDDKPERPEIVETLEKMGLSGDTMESTFSDLSTGQRQRVGLATCFLLKRDVILLDEPTSALDLESKKKIAELLLKNDRTVVSTSHDPWWVDRCDRVIDLNNGS